MGSYPIGNLGRIVEHYLLFFFPLKRRKATLNCTTTAACNCRSQRFKLNEKRTACGQLLVGINHACHFSMHLFEVYAIFEVALIMNMFLFLFVGFFMCT